MGVIINIQPAANSIVAAYRPIRFLLTCNQMPNNGDPSPVVMADIYFDGAYYASISVTDYDPLVFWVFLFNYYTIDIQDKVQEYLNSKFARMYENTQGDMENVLNEHFSCSIQVKFREGYIDADGFTQFYGTAPVQGTKFTAPVAGTGTATSNIFYGINASLTHEDNPDLGLHLNTFKDPFQTTYGLSHRPNFMTAINKTVAGGKYFICREDRDFIFWFANNSTPPWGVQVIGKYKDGATFNTGYVGNNYPPPTNPALPYKVYSFDAGIPNLRNMFGGVQWDNVIEYEVFVVHYLFQATRQYYYVNQGCCDEHDRIFFLNNLGAYDGINFSYKQEINKTNSDRWQSSPPSIWAPVSKSYNGTNRMQPKQNDFYEVFCIVYDEKDMNWIKELLGTPRAYLQWKGVQGQNDGLIPIVIEDSEIVTLKNKDRYEYIINLKYSMSNERINLRG